MIVEEISLGKLPNAKSMFSINANFSNNAYIKCIQLATPYFVSNYKRKSNKNLLNEDMISQILVIEVQKIISQSSFPFFVQIQFVDDVNLTRGKPDIFFFENSELGVNSKYLFFVEAKRLPSKTFETEYVMGEKKNGGIERFKLGIHGKGKKENGIIGYVQDNDCIYWHNKINAWINNFAKTYSNWNKSEKLNLVSSINKKFRYCNSVVLRKNSTMKLHHLLINLN